MTWVTAHLFEDAQLRDRARTDVARLGTLDPKTLCQSSPVLSSVFAETLRLHSTMYSMLTARGADANLGKWRLPQGQIGVVNTGLSHMDETVWNTREGKHPVTSFWGDRFLVYPDDPASGPLHPARRHHTAVTTKHKSDEGQEYASSAGADADGPTFSLEGLEGSWIPYGGESTSMSSSNMLDGVLTQLFSQPDDTLAQAESFPSRWSFTLAPSSSASLILSSSTVPCRWKRTAGVSGSTWQYRWERFPSGSGNGSRGHE